MYDPSPECLQFGHFLFELANPDRQEDFDPRRVTEILELTPGESNLPGDPVVLGGLPTRRRAGWKLCVPKREEFRSEVLVEELLDIVEPRAARVREVRDSFNLIAGINIYVEIFQSWRAPEIGLTAATVRRLSNLDLWFYTEQLIH